MSEFKRPEWGSQDPEESYRSGYQDGALAALQAVESGMTTDELKHWTDVKLQKWRHDRSAFPTPPK